MMERFFRNFDFDRLSFWLGFLGGTLFWWLLSLLRPWLGQWRRNLRTSAQAARESQKAGIEGQLRNATILKAQQMHMGSPLFSLEDILVTPRLIAPPPKMVPGDPPPSLDIAEQVIPYMPDWPELRVTYNAPTITLAEALQGDTHVVVLGLPGSGKTVALVHLALQLAHRTGLPAQFANTIPFLIYAPDLAFQPVAPRPILTMLADSIVQDTAGLSASRLIPYLTSMLEQGKAVLLLDGLEELPPEPRARALDILNQILSAYPKARCVATATPENFAGLPETGFVPRALATWNEKQRMEFLRKWGEGWEKAIAGASPENEPLETLLLGAWLSNDHSQLTPLELSLKAWSVFAGDNLGPSGSQALEAYVRRMCANEPGLRIILEKLARQIADNGIYPFTADEVQTCINELDTTPLLEKQEGTNPAKSGSSLGVPTTATHLLAKLEETGLIAARAEHHYTFNNPAIFSYLASKHASKSSLKTDGWSIAGQAARFRAAHVDVFAEVSRALQTEQEPLFSSILEITRWLRYAPENATWCPQVMRQVSAMIQTDHHPISLRARALTALATSGYPGVNTLFRQLLESKYTSVRLLGVLGLGQLRDAKSVPEIAKLMTDPTPMVRQAVCLALVAIGSQNALELVAEALLHGDENIRRWSAEALANHPEEGYPTLQDGSTLEDILVRRAVIYGLQRIREPWATELLEKMQVEDSQWVVKNAANQALEELSTRESRLPRKLSPLSELPWLIAFAGERGVGIAPGKPAQDLLLAALKDGSEEQKLAALDYIAQEAGSSAVLKVYQVLYSEQGEIREAAYNALWHISGSGVILPPPAEFGLGYALRQMP